MFVARHRLVRLSPLVLASALVACSDGEGPAPVPVSIVAPSPAIPAAEVASTLGQSPSFEVRDANGKAVGGVAVTITVGEGGGTLRNPPTRTANGATSVGQWTLGTRSGRNTLVVRAGALPPFTLEATALPGPPSEVRIAGGNDQLALAGDEVPDALAALVVDRFGNPVPQQTVRFDALLGGGTVAPATAVTGVDGIAGGVRWTLGRASSAQTARASIPSLAVEFSARARSDYTIDVRFVGTPSPPATEAFRVAAERIRTAVTGDVPDVAVQGLDVSRCGAGAGAALTETIDDVVIFASIAPIDGVGRVLGRAGPCYIRTAGQQSLVGQMTFDDADVPGMITSGRFESVVLHEMLHVVGIGSLWRVKGLVAGAGTGDPRFTGGLAMGRCLLLGFGTECDGGVPLENTGGSGTAEVHWRESIFDRELMTGFAEATADMPLSRLTLGALADYGYQVNEKAADPFQSLTARLGPRVAPGAASPGR
ncbi:MAG TPA: leishmanolysin-related zinc metalloendopeptidase, partial [Gemmatimonadaceae bacterium]|nr:leishmanolysin-related zinc metalloendopeptidase [Gemmatimonadaceae bacterium]